MTNLSGAIAENAAAEYIESQGYKVVSRNWRTTTCEIDIVAKLKSVMYFIEVKYRKNAAHGSGLDYITLKKLKQMDYAATLWIQVNGWTKIIH